VCDKQPASITNASIGQAIADILLHAIAIECANSAGGNVCFRDGHHLAQMLQAVLPPLKRLHRFAQYIFLARESPTGQLGCDALLDVGR
jgi:hypothetical protein